MNSREQLPWQNVVEGSTPFANLEKGPTYHGLVHKMGGTVFDSGDIANYRLKINSKTVVDVEGAHYRDMNDHRGLANDAAYLSHIMGEPKAKTIGGVYSGAIPTGKGVNSLRVEMDLLGTTAPTLQSFAHVSQPLTVDGNPKSALVDINDVMISGIIKTVIPIAGADTWPVIMPYSDKKSFRIKRLFFFHSNVTHFEIKKNGYNLVDKIALADYQYMLKDFGHVPQAGMFAWVPPVNNNFNDKVDTGDASTFMVKLTASAADTVTMYADVEGRLNDY